MPRYLMDHCLNNRTECCNTKVSFSRWPKVFRCSDDIPQFPEGKEQEELDTICEACPNAVIMIEDKCPVCLKYGVRLGLPKRVVLCGKLGDVPAYHYVCDHCGRDLYSEKMLIN